MSDWIRQRWQSLKSIPWVGLLAILAIAVYSGLTSDTVQGVAVFQGEPYPGWLRTGLTVAVPLALLFCFLYLYSQRRRLLGFGALEQSRDPEGHRGLVVSLSTSNQNVRIRSPNGANETVCQVVNPGKEEDGSDDEATIGLELPADPEQAVGKIYDEDWPKPGYWNWEQLVRAVAPHAETLEYVCLLGSKDSDNGSSGSHEHFDAAKKLIRHLVQAGSERELHFSQEKVVFEDVEKFPVKIEKGIKKIRRLAGNRGVDLEDEDLMIDATTGMKTASIAAAVVTLNSHVKFQYVSTSKDRVRPVWYYNVIRRHHEDLVG